MKAAEGVDEELKAREQILWICLINNLWFSALRNFLFINEFVLGNIAPDSGIPSKDGSGFIPDAAVSHFRSLDENGIKNIHEEQFIWRYFTPAHRLSYSKKEDAIFLGYLTHLLTDKIRAREIVYYFSVFFS